MPELPEVETVVRQLQKYLRGARVARLVHCAQRLRTPLDSAAITEAISDRAFRANRCVGTSTSVYREEEHL